MLYAACEVYTYHGFIQWFSEGLKQGKMVMVEGRKGTRLNPSLSLAYMERE